MFSQRILCVAMKQIYEMTAGEMDLEILLMLVLYACAEGWVLTYP